MLSPLPCSSYLNTSLVKNPPCWETLYYNIHNIILDNYLQSLLSQDKLEALKDFKNSEQERFYNELQNRVSRVYNDGFKDSRKVIPMIKVNTIYIYFFVIEL